MEDLVRRKAQESQGRTRRGRRRKERQGKGEKRGRESQGEKKSQLQQDPEFRSSARAARLWMRWIVVKQDPPPAYERYTMTPAFEDECEILPRSAILKERDKEGASESERENHASQDGQTQKGVGCIRGVRSSLASLAKTALTHPRILPLQFSAHTILPQPTTLAACDVRHTPFSWGNEVTPLWEARRGRETRAITSSWDLSDGSCQILARYRPSTCEDVV